MKTLSNMTLLLFAISLQAVHSAKADVVVSPVDKSPTAVQNSGATYDENDVIDVHTARTHPQKAEASLSDVSRMTNRNLAQDQTTSATHTGMTTVNSSDAALLDHSVVMNGVSDQQQQMEETHSATPWILGLITLLVAGAIYYVSRRDDWTRSHRI